MESAPFRWRADDARHLAKALRDAPGIGRRELTGIAVAAAIAVLAIAVTGSSTEWLLVAIALCVPIPSLLQRFRVWWIARWFRYHRDCLVTAEWNDTGYATFGCVHAPPSRIDWPEIAAAIETDRYVILQTGPSGFFLPKDALDKRAIDDLRAQLDRHAIKRIRNPGSAADEELRRL